MKQIHSAKLTTNKCLWVIIIVTLQDCAHNGARDQTYSAFNIENLRTQLQWENSVMRLSWRIGYSYTEWLTCLAVDAGVLRWTSTLVTIDEVDTRTAMLTRLRHTLINLCTQQQHLVLRLNSTYFDLLHNPLYNKLYDKSRTKQNFVADPEEVVQQVHKNIESVQPIHNIYRHTDRLYSLMVVRLAVWQIHNKEMYLQTNGKNVQKLSNFKIS